MSGHSKWSSIKHKKGKEDAKRGKLFSKLGRYITVAAKEGGGDTTMNAALANAVEKAKDANMPADNIDRAIKKGTGEIAGVAYEHIVYEGYGPGGVALLVDVMTDNKNRTAADMRFAFTKHSGKLAGSGSVAWMFERKGVTLVSSDESDEDTLLLLVADAGAEDVVSEDDHFEIISDASDLENVKAALEGEGIAYQSADITMRPKETVKVEENDARKLIKLMDALEELDDVNDVYSNFDIPDEIIEKLSS
jgi:YebC/PmpR family DNA-binding regulatory protein